jgi:hypothetical protein
MAVLDNSKHEHFALLVAKGVSASKAYTSAGYSAKGSAPSASRLLTNAKVCARIRELQETLSAGTIALEISSRNARVQALQNRWDRMRRVIDERAASPDFAEVPGGTTGLLVKDYKGKDADTLVYKVDTGLLAELRNHEKQAAEELGQWNEKRELPGDELQTEMTITFVHAPQLPASAPRQLPAGPPKTA